MWDSAVQMGAGWIVLLMSIALAFCVRMNTKVHAWRSTPVLALGLLLVGLWFGYFDGQPRVGTHVDATYLLWSFRVLQRGAAGLSLLFLAPLIARAARGIYDETQLVRTALLCSVPLSAGLIANALIYLLMLFMSEPDGPRFAQAHFAGTAALSAGAAVSLVITMTCILRVLSLPPSGSPRTF